MGFKDWFSKSKELAGENEEQASEAIDKVADVADDKTRGRYTDQIDTGAEKTKDFVEGLDED